MKVSFSSTAGGSWTSACLLALLFQPVVANILTRLPKCGEDGCHCTGATVGECPALPTINSNIVDSFRALELDNPYTIQCDPFASHSCVKGLTSGEACVVELVPPASGGGSCPENYSYQLKTVPSLEDAVAAGDYVTHVGPCGACSSLQDLATIMTTNQLPMRANDCYWRSGGAADLGTAKTCFESLGFSSTCARIMASYQDRINRSQCPSFCAAFALGQGQDTPACEKSSVCYPCINLMEARYKIVAGRVETNSGYPSWSASACDNIASADVISFGDVCQDAKTVGGSSKPVGQPTLAPVPSPTLKPTAASTPKPTNAKTPPPTPAATASANLQLCQEFAAIEMSLSKQSGGQVVCDCKPDSNSATPVCYKSPDRSQDQVCAIQFGACNGTNDCCSAGVRGCRGGQCRTASRAQLKSSLRLGNGRGGRGGGSRIVGEPARGESRGRRRIRGTT